MRLGCMAVIKFFTRVDCPNCPPAKALAEKLRKEGRKVEMFDIETPDGLAEAVGYDVMCTPSIIAADDAGKEIKSWRCSVPKKEEIEATL